MIHKLFNNRLLEIMRKMFALMDLREYSITTKDLFHQNQISFLLESRLISRISNCCLFLNTQEGCVFKKLQLLVIYLGIQRKTEEMTLPLPKGAWQFGRFLQGTQENTPITFQTLNQSTICRTRFDDEHPDKRGIIRLLSDDVFKVVK